MRRPGFGPDVDGLFRKLVCRTHVGKFGFSQPGFAGVKNRYHELQLELYRTLAESGALLVNDVRALTVAIDKFKTSWLLAQACRYRQRASRPSARFRAETCRASVLASPGTAR